MTIHVHVKPNSKTDSIEIGGDGTAHIKISATPVEGQANKYLVKYVSKIFKIPQSKIEIIKGHNNPYKTLTVDADENYVQNVLARFKK